MTFISLLAVGVVLEVLALIVGLPYLTRANIKATGGCGHPPRCPHWRCPEGTSAVQVSPIRPACSRTDTSIPSAKNVNFPMSAVGHQGVNRLARNPIVDTLPPIDLPRDPFCCGSYSGQDIPNPGELVIEHDIGQRVAAI